MNDQTLARETALDAPTMPGSPTARTILRFGIASTVGLFLVLSLFLAGRRFGGAFDQPLSSPTMLALGIGIAALAGCLRAAWPRATQAPAVAAAAWARLLMPSLAVFLCCYALSLPGSAQWAVALLWFLVVCEEGAWWLAGSPPLPIGRHGTSTNNRSPQMADSNDHQLQSQLDLSGDVDNDVTSDVTQQVTRMRDEDGSELVFGQARAEFVAGERSHSVHLAFCPPLSVNPRITVMHAGGPSAAITVAQAESFGARFDVRLAATARQPESVMIEFEARCEAANQAADATS